MRTKPLILVADDDKDLREVVRTKLEMSGFEIEEAEDGNEALEKAKKLLPDLALLDIKMPGGPSGAEVALRFKEMPETKDIKILFLSGMEDPWPAFAGTKEEVSKELGAIDFFVKSKDFSELVKKIEGILKGQN